MYQPKIAPAINQGATEASEPIKSTATFAMWMLYAINDQISAVAANAIGGVTAATYETPALPKRLPSNTTAKSTTPVTIP